MSVTTQADRPAGKLSGAPLERLATFEGMGHALKARIAFSPQRVALNNLDSGESYTYAEIGSRIDRLCSYLARQGVQRGDSIATNLENGADLIFLILSSLIFGTRLALIESQTPPARLKHHLDLVNPRAAFFSSGRPAGVPIDKDVLMCEMPWNGGAAVDDKVTATVVPGAAADDEAIVIFSSGTTGEPKGIIHTHNNIIAELDAMIKAYAFRESMQHYLMLPLAHASGLYRSLVMPFFTGGTVNLRRSFDSQTFWGDVERHEVEFVQLVPSHIALLNRSQHGPGQGRKLALQFAGTASGYLPPKEQRAFEERFGIPVLQGYGLTECTCGIVLNSLDRSIRRPGVAGLPLEVNQIKIVDSAEIEVEQGEVGEVFVRGKNIVTRFLGKEQPTIQNGWLKTGDMGRVESDGNIVLVGRRSNIINRGAYKIYALEVEEALASLPGVNEAAAIGVPHPVLGHDLIAFVTLDEPVEAAQLLGALREKISSFKIPTMIIPIDKMPQNKMGKIIKDDLLETYLSRQHTNVEFDESAILPRLCQLVADIFATDVEAIKATSSRDNVARWDSLGHVQVLAGIEQEFGVRISDEAAVAAQSVTDLANAIVHALRSEITAG